MNSSPSIRLLQSVTEQISVGRADSACQSNSSISVESSVSSYSSRRASESLSVDMLSLITQLSNVDEKLLIGNHGYSRMNKICDTLQGELYKASVINENKNGPKYVAIKRTEKYLFKERIAVEEEMNFCVSENICKEASILKYLTVENKPIGNYIAQYIDFFESETDYYLVMEYIPTQTNLKQFINKSKEYIQNGKLSLKKYRKIIKYLLWQLCVTIQWLHISMHCCHLDICSENIMIDCGDEEIFISTRNGLIINPNISIKICDFGVAELFNAKNENSKSNVFLCYKTGLSLHNDGFSSPKVFAGDIYDGRLADNWMLGIILFECLTVGKQLYKPLDIHKFGSGRWALKSNQLKQYLSVNNFLKYFNCNSFSVLNGLLNIHDTKRLNGMDILKHRWFNMYFRKYKKQIVNKFSKKGKKINKNNIDVNFYRYIS